MPLFGGTIESPRELYLHKLGAALTMEQTILDMLPELEEQAQDEQLRQALGQHRAQTEGHVRNLEQVFQLFGEDVDDSSCPAIEGLEKEGQATLKMADESLHDSVIVSAVCETEHYEIAVYEGLITNATAMGEPEVAALLERNLEQERQALETARQASQQLARSMAQVA